MNHYITLVSLLYTKSVIVSASEEKQESVYTINHAYQNRRENYLTDLKFIYNTKRKNIPKEHYKGQPDDYYN